ncbi:hypothetical protein [Candidatus Palauibacter sp.]|uniref:hypothetical protein n=1 Tax=Candidatus Palauibacter sp. TaxID=3101350 RepID=UPI003B02553F
MPDRNRLGDTSVRAPSRIVALASIAFLVLALSAVIMALSGNWGAWSEMAGAGVADWRVRPLWLVLAVLSGATALWTSGAIWGLLFRSSGGQTGMPEAAAVWLGSNLGRYLPGKVWQMAGLVGYVRARGDSGSGALATALLFQAIMLVTGSGIGLAVLGSRVFEGVGLWAIGAGGLAVAAALTPWLLRRIVRTGHRLLREPGEPAHVSLGGSLLIYAAVGSLFVWSLHGLGFWALLEGLVEENSVGPLMATGVFTASYIVGYLAVIAPGGMIVREGAMASLLSVAGSMALGPAAAVALAARLWATAAELAAFGLALSLARVARMREQPKR